MVEKVSNQNEIETRSLEALLKAYKGYKEIEEVLEGNESIYSNHSTSTF